MTLEEARKEMEKFVKLKTTQRPAFLDVILEATEGNPVRPVYCGDCRYLQPLEDIHGARHFFCAKRGLAVLKLDEYCSRGEPVEQMSLFGEANT